jgi:hypothetical protein
LLIHDNFEIGPSTFWVKGGDLKLSGGVSASGIAIEAGRLEGWKSSMREKGHRESRE